MPGAPTPSSLLTSTRSGAGDDDVDGAVDAAAVDDELALPFELLQASVARVRRATTSRTVRRTPVH